MSNKVKYISVKSYTFYFFDDNINIKNFDPNNINIDKKSYKNILIYYIGYVTIKDSKYVKINSVNPLQLMINKVNGYFWICDDQRFEICKNQSCKSFIPYYQ